MSDEWLRRSGQHGDVEVAIDLTHGGRLAQVTVDGIALLADPPADGERTADSMWGSFPMAPWAGRVRDGRFTWFGAERRLRLNHDDSGSGAQGRQHAIHGTVFDQAWTVEEQTPTALAIQCPLDQPDEPGWNLGGVAHQRFELLDGQLRCDMSISVPHDAPPIPATLGWHPWFRKPDALTFHPDAMYKRDIVGLPTGRLVAPSAGPWDDCFINTAPVTLHYDRPELHEITVSSDCDHWVIYNHPTHATCVEPQSGPPDAVNVRPQIVTGTHPLRHTMIIGW